VRGPLLLGAIFARASTDARAALERFARPLGIAFQLRDDLLGAFGDTAETGKPVGSDVRSGKHTALLSEARRLSSGAQRVRLDAVIAASRTAAMPAVPSVAAVAAVTDDDVRFVLDLFEAIGARRAVEARIDTLVDEARAALHHPALSPDGATLLGGLAALLAHRSA
jgi:geranylgeranyl diphosphate synthase type I